METVKRTKIKALLASEPGQEVLAKGWVRTKRGNKQVKFIALNDGSTINNIQIVANTELFDEELLKRVTTGASLAVKGQLVASMGSGQAVEIQASEIEVLGDCDPMRFPLQKKDTTLEYLRSVAHMRLRTNTFGAVLRIRNAMAFAIHKFFNEKGFVYLHTPLITESDAEGAPLDKKGNVDFSKDFFGKKTSLTVSGQLEGELGATAVGEIYTFGPTFRAENSNTPRHLAEFWMIEPEMAFYDINDNMALAEEFVKYLVQYALDNCMDDLQFLNDKYDDGLIERMRSVLGIAFQKVTYTEAVDILEKAVADGVKFEYPVHWGTDFQSEHERYLVEKHFQKPVILIDFPKDIKAFYMKQNEDGRTVRGMDVLFPKIGEIIGGSEREASLEKLEQRIDELGMRSRAPLKTQNFNLKYYARNWYCRRFRIRKNNGCKNHRQPVAGPCSGHPPGFLLQRLQPRARGRAEEHQLRPPGRHRLEAHVPANP